MRFRNCLLQTTVLASLALPGAAGAQVEGTTVDIRFGPNPGEIIFDATELKALLPSPTTPREFPSEWDLIDFMTGVLNAEPIVDEGTGELLGFNGRFQVLDQPCVPDPADDTVCRPVEDTLREFIGGAEGKIIIAGEELCVDESKCDFVPITQTFVVGAALGPPNATTNSTWEDIIEDEADAEPFEIQGRSFALGAALRTIGTKTTQMTGGYKRMHEVCDWIVIGVYCWDERGWNNLKTETFFTDADGNVMEHRVPAWCGNCAKVVDGTWGISWGRSPPDLSPWIYKGVYGWHWGEGEEGDMCDGSCDATGCISGP